LTRHSFLRRQPIDCLTSLPLRPGGLSVDGKMRCGTRQDNLQSAHSRHGERQSLAPLSCIMSPLSLSVMCSSLQMLNFGEPIEKIELYTKLTRQEIEQLQRLER
jgi:hypothetical protein